MFAVRLNSQMDGFFKFDYVKNYQKVQKISTFVRRHVFQLNILRIPILTDQLAKLSKFGVFM
jgi:hypothetical protein